MNAGMKNIPIPTIATAVMTIQSNREGAGERVVMWMYSELLVPSLNVWHSIGFDEHVR